MGFDKSCHWHSLHCAEVTKTEETHVWIMTEYSMIKLECKSKRLIESAHRYTGKEPKVSDETSSSFVDNEVVNSSDRDATRLL